MNARRVFDFTVWPQHWEGNLPEPDELASHLWELGAKRFVFQYEDAGSGTHIQGKVWLKLKTRSLALRAHYTPTTKCNLGKTDYVTKEASRVRGPFDSKRMKPLYYRHQNALDNPHPWQTELVELLPTLDDRKIVYIYETTGCTGKSTWSAAMEMKGDATMFNLWNEPKEVMEAVYAQVDEGAVRPLLLFDLPRAGLTVDRKAQCMRYIEAIKTGKIVDPRHSFKKKWIYDPMIVVFSNETPDKWINMQSQDRWVIRKLQNNRLEFL